MGFVSQTAADEVQTQPLERDEKQHTHERRDDQPRIAAKDEILNVFKVEFAVACKKNKQRDSDQHRQERILISCFLVFLDKPFPITSFSHPITFSIYIYKALFIFLPLARMNKKDK